MIHVTTDYTIFKKQHANRPINQGHVKRLAQSMVKYGFLPAYHIIVDGNMQVVDGQHRIEAAQMMGVPVHYVVQEEVSIEVNRDLNTLSRKWGANDYLESYALSGHNEYIKLKAFLDYNKITLSSFLRISHHPKTHMKGKYSAGQKNFRSGKFSFNIEEYQAQAFRIMSYMSEAKGSKSMYFAGALASLTKIDGFDIDRFFDRYDKYPSKYSPGHDTQSYLEMLVELYNYKTRQEFRIRID